MTILSWVRALPAGKALDAAVDDSFCGGSAKDDAVVATSSLTSLASTAASSNAESSCSLAECQPPADEELAEEVRPCTEAEVVAPHEVGSFVASDYESIRFLSEPRKGGSSGVNLVRRLADGKLMALKRLPAEWMTKGHTEFVQRHPLSLECPWYDLGLLRYFSQVGFRHACRLEGVLRDSTHICVLTSFADQGDLFTWSTQKQPKGERHEARMRPLVTQIVAAVRWLHDRGISHRDLSLENIFLSSGEDCVPQVKLADFGQATSSKRFSAGLHGKKSYMAPEMHLGKFDSFLGDAFALGVVIFVMALEDYPWHSTRRGECQDFDAVVSSGLRSALSQRLARHSGGRSMEEVLSPDLLEVLLLLLEVRPEVRGTLGERCFEATDRLSVWDLPWLWHASKST